MFAHPPTDKAVFPKQEVVGWYVTSPALQDVHLPLHRKVCELNESPLVLLLDTALNPAAKDLPITVYETGVSSICCGVGALCCGYSHVAMLTNHQAAEQHCINPPAPLTPEVHVSDGVPTTTFVRARYSMEVCVCGCMHAQGLLATGYWLMPDTHTPNVLTDYSGTIVTLWI